MSPDKKVESESYTFPFYLVELGRPFHKVKDANKSESWKALEAEAKIGSPTVRAMFPLAAATPKAFLARTKEMKEEMILAIADEDGNVVTDNPDIARRALENGKAMNNPNCRLHPRSLPLNDVVPKGRKVAK